VMTAPLVILATLAVVVGLVGSPLTDYALGKYLGEHVAGGMNYALAAIAVGAALAGIGYAWLMYQRGKANPDWYMRNRSISTVLSRQFWIDEVYTRAVVTPTMAIAGVLRRVEAEVIDAFVGVFGRLGLFASSHLAKFDRTVVDGAVDGLGNAVVEGGRETRKIETGNVQTYLLLLAASIIVLLLVFAR
jgi:NADH-quinone oxidoreductase subunit L